MTENDTNSDDRDHGADLALPRELAVAAREISLYLRHRRAAEERRQSLRITAVLFVVTLIASATVTRALSNHFARAPHKVETDIIKVAGCVAPL